MQCDIAASRSEGNQVRIMTLVMDGGGVLCYPIHYITDVPTQQMIANSGRGAERGDVITVSQSTAKTRVSCVRLLPPRTH